MGTTTTDNTVASIAANLARIRKRCDKSQRELAVACGVSHVTIARIERGHRKVLVMPATIRALAAGLGVSERALTRKAVAR